MSSWQATEFQQELAEFIQANGLNVAVMKVRCFRLVDEPDRRVASNSSVWLTQVLCALQNVVRSLLVFFQDAMKEGWNLSQLKAKAMERGAEDAAANVFCEAWRVSDVWYRGWMDEWGNFM